MEQGSVRPQRKATAEPAGRRRPRATGPGPRGWSPLPPPPPAPLAVRGSGLAWEVTLALLAVGILVGLATALLLSELWLADRVLPGVRVWNVDLGGLTREQAVHRLAAEFHYPEDRHPTLRYADQVWTPTPEDLGVQLDAPASVEAAMIPGHRGNLRTRFEEQVDVLTNGWMTMPLFSTDPGTGTMYLGRIAQQVNRPARDATLEVGQDLSVQVVPRQIGVEIEDKAALQALVERITAMEGGEVTLTVRESDPVLTDLSAAQAAVQRILSGPIVLTAPEFEPWTIEPATLAQWLVLEPTIGADGQPTLAASLNRRRISALVEQLAPQVARDPRNAKFRLDVARNVVVPVVESVPGQSLDITTTVSLVDAAAASEERSVTLPFVPIAPAISTRDLPDVRSFDLISEGVTNFSGSSSARVKNITVGSAQFDGLLIRPGETFSFNKYLGEVSAEKGYADSIIIWGNQLKTDVGGGLCQVSSTAFRAAFWAGVPIVERHAHAFRVSYYEPPKGMDATIFTPSVDLRWLNDTGEYILIRTSVDTANRTVSFRFYGKNPGRTVEIDGPHEGQLIKPDPPVYRDDPSLPKGQTKLIEAGKDGLDVTVYRIVKENGQEVRRDKFVSRYRPWRAVYLIGTKEG